MIFNPTKLKEYTKQLLFALLAVLLSTTVSHAEYNSIYFDARLDTGNHRLRVYPREGKMNGEFGYEDDYVKEWIVDPTEITGSGTDQEPRSGDNYNKAMAPKDSDGPYKNKELDRFAEKFSTKRSNVANGTPSSKKNTIPAALYTYKEGGRTYGHSGLKSSSNRLRILKNSICGDQDDREGKGVSMVTGFNILLEKIELLRGGYTDSTFKETVKGLTWLLSEHATKNEIIFDISKSNNLDSNTEVISEDEEPEEVNTTDPEGDDYVGNGNDIKITVESVSDYKKTVTIYQKKDKGGQKEDEDDWLKIHSHRQIYRLATGYEVVGDVSADGVATIKITDAELSEKNNRTYETKSGSTLKGLTADDVKWISLYDLVFEAYVKMLDGVPADSSDAGASDNIITRIVVDIFSDMVDFIESELGMDSIEELVYNKEGREHSGSDFGYLLGLFPEAWLPLINQGMSMVAIVSVLFLTFAILRVLYMMNLDSMNVSTRLNLKQDIANIIYSVLGMMLFITVFYVIALLNYKLTGILYTTMGVEDGGEAISFTETFMRNEGLIGGLILRIVMIGVTAYVNVVYIIRGINIAIILMLAPVFIIGTAFNGPERMKVLLRELLGNIGVQTLHALLIVFIAKAKTAMAFVNGGTMLFVSVVMVSSIIPVTGMFRELVFGENKSLLGAGRIATNAKNTATELGKRGTIMAASIAGGTIASGAAIGSKLQTMDQFNNFNKFKEKQKLEAFSDVLKEAGLGGKNSASDSEGSAGVSDTSTGSKTTGTIGAKNVSAGSETTGTESTAGVGTIGTGDTSNSATQREVNNTNSYFDPDLEKGFDRKDRFKVQVANDLNNISNLIAVFKSKGKADTVDRFLNGVNQSKEMQKYMQANKYKDRQSQMEKYTKEAEETVGDGNEK